MVAVETQRTLTAFHSQVVQRIDQVEALGQGTELRLAFHPRGKESYWELQTITYERFRVMSDRQFLAVE